MGDINHAPAEAQDSGEKLLTVREVQTELRLGERAVYRALNRGTIPGVKLGSTWRVRRRDLDRVLTPQDSEQVPAR